MATGKFLEEFPPVSTEQWEQVIVRDLKGADYAKKLLWQSDEQITVKPYYRSADTAGLEYLGNQPGLYPYTRGTGGGNNWLIREPVTASNIGEARKAATAALAAGAQGIEFVCGTGGLQFRDQGSIAALVEGLNCPVHFEARTDAANTLRIIAAAAENGITLAGSIDYDPVLEGGSVEDAAAVRQILRSLPRFRPIVVRAHRFRESGSTITQELGYAIAAGIEYMAQLTAQGLTPSEAASAIAFSFAAGSNFFFEVAKLRAARTLWARAVEAFGDAHDAAKATIYVRTSRWHETIYDPYVNILRATTEAMSAVAGGCEALTVLPFDETYKYPDDFSRRIARNLQLILKHEAWLDRTTDPAGGSYYVDVLTDSLARAAWGIVQKVEAEGGFSGAWAKGSVQAEIKKSHDAQKAAVGSRRRVLVGTNQYPNLQERMLEKMERPTSDLISPRAAEVFDAIRLRTEEFAAGGGTVPLFLLIETGDPKMRAARAGFVRSFFGCAGFALESAVVDDIDAAVRACGDKNPQAVVLCSSDDAYPEIAGPFIAKLRESGRTTPVIVAGYPKEAVQQLTDAGVADFIHIRSNAAETLRAWQQRLGVTA